VPTARMTSGASAAQYEKIARLQPNDPTVFHSLALIQRRQGHWPESLANSRKAAQLDPASISYARAVTSTLRFGRRWHEAIAAQRRVIALLPARIEEKKLLAELSFLATGSEKEHDELFGLQSPAQLESPSGIRWRKFRAYTRADLAEYKRLDELQPYYDATGEPHYRQAADAACYYVALGDVAAARARLGNFPSELRARLQTEPANAGLWADLALMEACLGHHDEALACGRKAVGLRSESLDAVDSHRHAHWNADVRLIAGERDAAIADYARLLRLPGATNVHEFKIIPWYASLRSDPRWIAMLNDPKNNAPLF
jgi:tetratricopeptide (TPR) repeat protein